MDTCHLLPDEICIHTGIFKGCGYSSRLWLQFLKDVATGKNGRFAREFSVSQQLMRISLEFYAHMIYLTEHKKHAVHGLTHRYVSWYGLNRV